MNTSMMLVELIRLPNFTLKTKPGTDGYNGDYTLSCDYGVYDCCYQSVDEALFHALIFFKAKEINARANPKS